MASKTDYVLALILFYTVELLLLNAWGQGFEQSQVSVLGVDIKIGLVGVIYILPLWVNTLIIAINVFTGWLILSSLTPSGS